MIKAIRFIVGSEESDAEKANFMLDIFREVGVPCNVTVLSSDRDMGDGFQPMIESVKEPLIIYFGGMDLAAPAAAATILRNAGRIDQVVFGVPTDTAARSAIENRPQGNPILTCGLNETSARHSIINSALMVAQLAGMLFDRDILNQLKIWYTNFRDSKPMKTNLALKNGLMPVKEKKH